MLIAHPSRIPSAELKQQSRQQVDAHDAVVTTYGTVMRTDWIKVHPWRNVILDEAQAIKNPGARQTQTVKALESKWRLALTGTPVENLLGDLWSIFDFLNPRASRLVQGLQRVLQVHGLGLARRLCATAPAQNR